MCLVYCHLRGVLLDSDTDEVCGSCPHNLERGRAGQCAACAHRQSKRCGLTGATLPLRGWCCHHNAGVGVDELVVTGADLRGALRFASLPEVFELYDVAYVSGPDGWVVAVADLARPLTYGVPTVHWDVEDGVADETGVDFVDLVLDETAYRLLL